MKNRSFLRQENCNNEPKAEQCSNATMSEAEQFNNATISRRRNNRTSIRFILLFYDFGLFIV